MIEISVIITNFNYEKFLARSVRSAVNQSLNPAGYEIIVIDDCSTDNSKEIINMLAASGRVKPIFNDKNMGLAATCNKAIRAALGKYVIRVDADDYIHDDCLKLHKLFLENNKNDMDATSSDYYEVDSRENVLKRRNGVTWPIACGIMYKIDHVYDVGMYNETLPREDVDFRQNFIKKYRIYNIPIPLYRYTIHRDSKTRNENAKDCYV